MQRLQGNGLALVHAGRCDSGNETERGGNRCGLTRVDTGCLLAIEQSVYYDIQFVGGIKTAFLGGEGLFFCETNRSRNRLFTDTSFFKAG